MLGGRRTCSVTFWQIGFIFTCALIFKWKWKWGELIILMTLKVRQVGLWLEALQDLLNKSGWLNWKTCAPPLEQGPEHKTGCLHWCCFSVWHMSDGSYQSTLCYSLCFTHSYMPINVTQGVFLHSKSIFLHLLHFNHSHYWWTTIQVETHMEHWCCCCSANLLLTLLSCADAVNLLRGQQLCKCEPDLPGKKKKHLMKDPCPAL